MPKIYSLDFRKCVIKNFHSGKSVPDILSTFKISKKTLYNWLNLAKHKDISQYNVRRLYNGGKIPPSSLESELLSSPDLTLKELSEKFSCCFQAISYRCKSLGITRKKNHPVSRKK